MPQEIRLRVHFIDGAEKIVPAKDIQWVGGEGAQRATALVDGREVPIYKRSEPEWGPLWYEQEIDTGTWVHSQAGLAIQFKYQDKGETISVDYTTILGEIPETGVWIVRIDGSATDRYAEYWWDVTEYLAVRRGSDGITVIDDVTDEQIALFEKDEDEEIPPGDDIESVEQHIQEMSERDKADFD